MAGGADDHGFFVRGAEGGESRRGAVGTEVNDDVALGEDGLEIVAFINLADDLQIGMLSSAGDEGPAHAAFGTGDDDSCHG